MSEAASSGTKPMRRGEITNLRRTYRVRLARYVFVLEHSKLAVFNPEE